MMATALVVDDSKVDQRLAGGLLETRADMAVVYADNGREALEKIEADPPDLVLTDMQMPEMDGLALVEAIAQNHSRIPVILMTAIGSEEIAAKALAKGAASYVPKRFLSRDLVPAVEHVMAVLGADRQQQTALRCLARSVTDFTLNNDHAQIQPLVSYLKQEMQRLNIGDQKTQMRSGVALAEAISNAMDHGNLEADSTIREMDQEAYFTLIDSNRTQAPYCDRHVFVTATFQPGEARFVIRDEGKGFDPAGLPDPHDPSQLDKPFGRGLLLIRTFMDEVHHNERGNEITMVKRAAEEPPS